MNAIANNSLKLKPRQYLDAYFPGSTITTKTIINWIKSGKLAGYKTPTGRWLVMPNKDPNEVRNEKLELESSALLNQMMGEK